MSSLNCDRQRHVKFRGTLRILTGTRAGGRMDCPIPWMLVILQSATLPYVGRRGHTGLTVLRLSDNQLCSRRTVWQGQSNQYCTKRLNYSPPSAPLYINTSGEFRSPGSTLTYSSLETSNRSIGAAHWPESDSKVSALVCL